MQSGAITGMSCADGVIKITMNRGEPQTKPERRARKPKGSWTPSLGGPGLSATGGGGGGPHDLTIPTQFKRERAAQATGESK